MSQNVLSNPDGREENVLSCLIKSSVEFKEGTENNNETNSFDIKHYVKKISELSLQHSSALEWDLWRRKTASPDRFTKARKCLSNGLFYASELSPWTEFPIQISNSMRRFRVENRLSQLFCLLSPALSRQRSKVSQVTTQSQTGFSVFSPVYVLRYLPPFASCLNLHFVLSS